MRNRLVYDLPTRLFHWLFAGLFATAFTIANTVDDESPVFAYHMLAGLTLVFAVILRIIWGFVGTRNARFASFPMRPKADLLAYFRQVTGRGEARTWGGHNPASSWAAVLMIICALGLGTTGYLMTSGGEGEAYREIHELFANAFLVIVLLHLAGIAVHLLRHRDGFALSMVDGRKQEAADADTVADSKPAVGFLFFALVALFAGNLVRSFDVTTQSLPLFGARLQLGENENQERAGEHEAGHESHEDEG
jgi:cytochrome b